MEAIEAKKKALTYRRNLRAKVLSHYGGKCSCCGESTPEFLAIDHTEGGGHD